MSYMYATALFLLVITTTSSVLCSSSNNDGEIFMVVEEQTSYMQPRMAQTPVQLGRFSSKEGKLVTLSRPVNGKENCIGPDQPCGALDWCCEGLSCDGFFDGRCHAVSSCYPAGHRCALLSDPCCYPYTCNAPTSGTCE